ncbi:cytidine deaminase-like protein [Nitzschia inconspicua]|uniref:Cytidine deaminase-like protein n=1 Tax=Nitzschia inconspicua TaxID=303405 RepID=A0A9K3L955_9STRA|nr:cytidine deaminase-like protein [Nitzschia inconspicua]
MGRLTPVAGIMVQVVLSMSTLLSWRSKPVRSFLLLQQQQQQQQQRCYHNNNAVSSSNHRTLACTIPSLLLSSSSSSSSSFGISSFQYKQHYQQQQRYAKTRRQQSIALTRRCLSMDGTNNVSAISSSSTTTSTSTSTTTSSSTDTLSTEDVRYLSQALDLARLGAGQTFPNPAVGCVLVNTDTQTVIGAGFHPRAGYPHAEVFALLQAAGRIDNGVAAAKSILDGTFTTNTTTNTNTTSTTLQSIMEQYNIINNNINNNNNDNKNGPQTLLENVLIDQPVTAYVTLEPCCHYGKTPPCASSLVLAKVRRVVVGCGDPNPRVDGGGIQILRRAGIIVDVAGDDTTIHQDCAHLIGNFIKRVRPSTPHNNNNNDDDDDTNTYSYINGAMRRVLRTIAGRKKTDNTLTQVNWTGNKIAGTATTEHDVDQLELPAEWMERVDGLLWENELVNLRLNKVVGKKKLARQLAERVASTLNAHVAQSLGHTALLYRPGIPPILNLEELAVIDDNNNDDDDDDDDDDDGDPLKE